MFLEVDFYYMNLDCDKLKIHIAIPRKPKRYSFKIKR